MSSLLKSIANEYLNFQVKGKKVNIPYCIVKPPNEKYEQYHMGRTDKYLNYAGKGTPEQIKKSLLIAAKKRNFDLDKASAERIAEFMEKEGIGIDCSGYVYNILNAYLKKAKGVFLGQNILRYPGLLGKIERFLLQKNRVRRVSGTTLTSNLNTIKIYKVKDILPGDMLRLTHTHWSGKHPALILNLTKDEILYTHCSEYSQKQGPHLAKIKILDPEKGLEFQDWLELTQRNENYGKYAFDPKRGDSVRRLLLRGK